MDVNIVNIQGLPHDTLTTVVGAVKVLSVNLFNFDLDMTIELMKYFPHLEKLYIHQGILGYKNLWRRKHRVLLKSLDIRLKTVVMQSYTGIGVEVSFATFFIPNAKVLELMKFQVDDKHCTRQFLAKQRKSLQLDKRASRGARFQFQTGRMLRCYSEVNNVRDLHLSDPFVC
ncbi:uncharacterized protein LOC100825870 isoform X1 [Brachypodium distachyon]|uniref:Uncharacterized protein n=1 Tax=Brachypodium distachyon TaxID=15368 RepID=A0A0Q3PAL3_BRADI|nr:uncharacterized protein LOC100825870 isoform X1 [Brachypodium distachyon]KQJ86081.1 hypothetical protein BRADI_4g03172v3 [Brachypodium distachyon]|eukprot:XP_024319326.1 uncharacterized protein LOC100825870 isoform X1 [Brachypodium distachyon]